MSSLFRTFPDPYALLSLDSDELAYHLLPYFRSLPWKNRSGVVSCLSLAAQLYPRKIRASLLRAFIFAWDSLHERGTLNATGQSAPSSLAPSCQSAGLIASSTCPRLAVSIRLSVNGL